MDSFEENNEHTFSIWIVYILCLTHKLGRTNIKSVLVVLDSVRVRFSSKWKMYSVSWSRHSSSNKKRLLLRLLLSFKSSLQSLTVIKSSLIVNLICMKSGRLSCHKIHWTDTKSSGKSTSKLWRCYINHIKRKTVRNRRKRATQSLI